LLHQVRWVEPATQSRVETCRDKGVQAAPVAGQQPLQGLPVAGADLFEQVARLRRVRGHLEHVCLRSVIPQTITDVTTVEKKNPRNGWRVANSLRELECATRGAS